MSTITTAKKPTPYSELPEEEKERIRTYQREYRRTHKERVREWNRRFYLRQAAKLLQDDARITAAAGEGDGQ